MPTQGHAPILTVIHSHPEIQLAILFGSLATGRARPDSDLDLAVAADHPLDAEATLQLIADLAAAVGRPVDLSTAGEPLLAQILKTGKRLAGSDERYAALITRHLFDKADFMPYYRRILAERRRAWIGR